MSARRDKQACVGSVGEVLSCLEAGEGGSGSLPSQGCGGEFPLS